MTPEECRAYADECAPRTLSDGWTLNPQHLAIESSLRAKHGHPGFIPELDSGGAYRDLPGPEECIQIGVTPDRQTWEVSADGHVIRWVRSIGELGYVVAGTTDVKAHPPNFTVSWEADRWVGPSIELAPLSWESWQDNGGPDVAPVGYIPGG